MKQNYDTVKLNADNNQRIRAQALVEEICDRFNLHNYFGILTIVVDEAMDLIYNNRELSPEFMTDFIFEQCVNGVCFSFKSNEEIFTEVSELMEMLTNEYHILDSGKTLELIFYVNGIDKEDLKTRQKHFKVFFKNNSLSKEVSKNLHKENQK